MVEPHSLSPRNDGNYHSQYHPAVAKQSLSTFEYNNSRDVRRGVVANNNTTTSNSTTGVQGTSDRVARIPDGFKSSRAFETRDVWKPSKIAEQSSFYPRSDSKNTPPPMFIRPTVSSTHSNVGSTSHTSGRNTSSRPTRNNDVSELFLAEAKAAQAKLEMEIDGNSSLDSFNTYEAMIDRPKTLTRQNSSSSSIDAVGPSGNDTKTSSKPFITLQVVDHTVQMSTTKASNSRPQQHPSRSLQTHRYPNDDDDEYEHHAVHHHQHDQYRSHRKPLGLTYALRKTDSGSTFQSLDGLSNSLPLIRHESKKKQKQRSSSSSKRKHKRQSTVSSTSSTPTFTSTFHTSLSHCNPAFDYSNRFACFSAPTCLPIDHIKESFNDYRHRYYASTSYKNQPSRESETMIDKSYEKDNSPSKQREGPELSSPSPSRINVLQQHQLHSIRDRQHPTSKNYDSPEISTHVVVSPSTIHSGKMVVPTKKVRFATTLVTKVNYRPYTPQSEIAVLYFQEEELEELECDRETVCGDQFECQFDEAALAVHIAYQKVNPTDE